MYLQLGTLGAGNHYAEIQVVDEIFNEYAAKKMGIDHKGQVCVMIHSGSRGLGHQVATGIFFGLVLKSTFYGEPYRDLRESPGTILVLLKSSVTLNTLSLLGLNFLTWKKWE